MELVGAGRGIVGIKGKYGDVIDLLRPKLAADMEIIPLRDAYPAGDEFILVYDCLRRVVPPGGIPLAVGAVVMNVETAMNIARADREPVTEKFLTIAGDVAHPVTLRVPIGVTLAQCVAAAGGATIADANYMVGGVMMGSLQEDHNALVNKTTGGVIVLPDEHVVVRRRRQDWPQIVRIGRSACDQCSFLYGALPAMAFGAPDRAASSHAEPRIQSRGRGQRHRNPVLLRVQLVQPLLVSGRPRSQKRLHAEQAAAGCRKEAVGEAPLQSPAARNAPGEPQERR